MASLSRRWSVRARRAAAAFVVLALIAAACGGTDEGDDPSAVPASSPTAEATPDPPETDPTAVTEPTVSLDELTERALDGDPGADVELALASFAIDFGPVDGAPVASYDDTAPAAGTGTLSAVARVWEQLDETQQQQVIDALDAQIATATLVAEIDGEAEAGAGPGDGSPVDPERYGGDPLDDPDAVDDEEGAFGRDPGTADVVLASFAGPTPTTFTNTQALAIARASAGWMIENLGGSLNFNLLVSESAEAPRPTINGSTFTLRFGVGEVVVTDFASLPGAPCRIQIFRHEGLIGSALLSVISHEVFHCWSTTNAPDFLLYPGWLLEGLATWVGEQFAGGSSYGQNWSVRFVEQSIMPLYRTTYQAFGFFAQVTEQIGGPAAMFDRIPSILAAGPSGNEATFAAATDGFGLEEIAGLSASAAQQPSWGAEWTFSGVGVAAAGRKATEVSVSEGGAAEQRSKMGEQQLVEYSLTPSGAVGPWVVGFEASGAALARWADGTTFAAVGDTSRNFCLDGDCVCPDGEPPVADLVPAPSRDLTLALGGTAGGDSTASMSLTALDDLCDDEPETLALPAVPGGDAPQGLDGTWRAANEALTGAFAQAFVDLGDGFGVAAVTGDVIMTIAADGTGTVTYTGVTLFFENSPVDTITLDGRGDFAWSIDGDGAFVVRGTSFQMVASSPALGEFPLEIPETTVLGGATSRYSISPPTGELILVQLDATATNNSFFPNVWFRQ